VSHKEDISPDAFKDSAGEQRRPRPSSGFHNVELQQGNSQRDRLISVAVNGRPGMPSDPQHRTAAANL